MKFTTGQANSGSAINAWVESYPQNTATNTVVWVTLPSSIASGGTLTIYMNFMSSSQFSSSGPLGEAPQFSSTYGQYDDGGIMGFNAYTGFEGTTFASPWAASAGSVNNGYHGSYPGGSDSYLPYETTYYSTGMGYIDVAALSWSGSQDPRVGWTECCAWIYINYITGPGIFSEANPGDSTKFTLDAVGDSLTDTVDWAFVAPYPPSGVYPSASFGAVV